MSPFPPPVWFITGCSSGVGRELARRVLGRGWRAVVTACDLRQVRDLVQGCEDRAIAATLDLTDPRQVREAAEAAHARFGHIDVLVNNVGCGGVASAGDPSDQEKWAPFDTAVGGLAAMTRTVLPGMRARRSGCIVNLLPDGLAGVARADLGLASAVSVEGPSDRWAKEWAPWGLRLLNVATELRRTPWADDRAEHGRPRHAQAAAWRALPPGDPVRAAEALIVAVQSPEPPMRRSLGAPVLDTA